MQRLLFLFILMLVINKLTAQRTPPMSHEMDLAACIAYAKQHSPELSIEKERKGISKQEYLIALGKLLPTVNAQISAGLNFGNSRDYTTQAMTANNTFSNQLALNAHLLIFDGMSSIYNLKQTRYNQLLSENKQKEAEARVAYQVLEAFLNAAYYKQVVEIVDKQLESSRQHFLKSERLQELGLIGGVELIEAEAKVAEDEYLLTQQQNRFQIGMLILKERLNYPIEDDLILAVNLNYNMQQVIESPMEIYRLALSELPQAEASQHNVDMQRMRLKSAWGALTPIISMDLGISSSYFKYLNNNEAKRWSWSDQIRDNKGEYIQFNLSIPLFTGFKRSASIRQSRAYYQIAKYEQISLHNRIYSDINQTIADVNGQIDDYAKAIKQQELMEKAHQQNLKKYNEGLIDPLQLNISANRLLKAHVDCIKSYYDYVLKFKVLRYYMGIAYEDDLTNNE